MDIEENANPLEQELEQDELSETAGADAVENPLKSIENENVSRETSEDAALRAQIITRRKLKELAVASLHLEGDISTYVLDIKGAKKMMQTFGVYTFYSKPDWLKSETLDFAGQKWASATAECKMGGSITGYTCAFGRGIRILNTAMDIILAQESAVKNMYINGCAILFGMLENLPEIDTPEGTAPMPQGAPPAPAAPQPQQPMQEVDLVTFKSFVSQTPMVVTKDFTSGVLVIVDAPKKQDGINSKGKSYRLWTFNCQLWNDYKQQAAKKICVRSFNIKMPLAVGNVVYASGISCNVVPGKGYTAYTARKIQFLRMTTENL